MRAWKQTVLCVLALAPALAGPVAGEVVRLRDGSTLRGRLMAVAGDSLVVRLSVGPRITIHRSQVVAIAFDDSLAGELALPAAAVKAPAPAGTGRITVAFKDKEVSSKISIDKKKAWDEHVRSNHIVVELLVNGRSVHAAVDTTMDKTIYKGHITQLKNDAMLEDFTVEVPAGTHQCEVIVRNFDEKTYRDDFDPEPLHAALVLDALEVKAGEGTRIEVGIDKGTLKMGHAKLYRVE
jgi:hypothetical protein